MESKTTIDVQAEQKAGGLVVRIIGSAGVDQVDELDRELHLLTVLAPKLVVLDLSAMPYISSMGIGSLLRFRNQIAEAGGKLAVANLQKNVSESFRLAGLGKVLPIHASVDEALAGSAG